MPSQHAIAQTTMIVARELPAMAATEGGGGATVMPAMVKPSMRMHSAPNPSFLPVDKLAPARNSQRPSTTMIASSAGEDGTP